MAMLTSWLWYSSIVGFAAVAADKFAAKIGIRRLSENSLHLIELIGGWPGSCVAMALFRHKTRKGSFMAVTGVIVAGWVVFLYRNLTLFAKSQDPTDHTK